MDNCKNCGGDMIGDGYTSVIHCEYADHELIDLCEPDCSPIFCDFKEDEGNALL